MAALRKTLDTSIAPAVKRQTRVHAPVLPLSTGGGDHFDLGARSDAVPAAATAGSLDRAVPPVAVRERGRFPDTQKPKRREMLRRSRPTQPTSKTVRASDRDELATWFALYFEPLREYLLKRTANPQLASDVCQEAFSRLIRAQHDEPLIQTPQAYLFRIAGKLAYEQRLHDRRKIVTFNSVVADRAVKSAGAVSGDLSEQIDNERLIDSALRRLPSRHAAMLVMKGRDGMSMKEIAKIMGLSENTVRKYLSRAVSMIRMQRGLAA